MLLQLLLQPRLQFSYTPPLAVRIEELSFQNLSRLRCAYVRCVNLIELTRVYCYLHHSLVVRQILPFVHATVPKTGQPLPGAVTAEPALKKQRVYPKTQVCIHSITVMFTFIIIIYVFFLIMHSYFSQIGMNIRHH